MADNITTEKKQMLMLDAEVVRCLKCGEDNTFLSAADIYEYGVWIARDQTNTCFSRVQLINNPVFDEFLGLIKQICIEHNIEDYEKYLSPEITQELFPVACDPVKDNSISFRSGPRVCKHCGSHDLSGKLSKPLSSIAVETFDVTYDSWNNKTQEARKQLVLNALREAQIIIPV
jgi:hypothetical protein